MLEHFWLICGVWCGVGNALLVWSGRGKYVKQGLMTEDQVRAFAKGIAFWILVPCVVFWLLQLSIGPGVDPMFPKWPAPQRMLAIGMQIFLWAALLFWVFLRDGADMLSAYFSVGNQGPAFLRGPGAMKVGACVAVVSGVIALMSV